MLIFPINLRSLSVHNVFKTNGLAFGNGFRSSVSGTLDGFVRSCVQLRPMGPRVESIRPYVHSSTSTSIHRSVGFKA